jgi:hypothetical protein
MIDEEFIDKSYQYADRFLEEMEKTKYQQSEILLENIQRSFFRVFLPTFLSLSMFICMLAAEGIIDESLKYPALALSIFGFAWGAIVAPILCHNIISQKLKLEKRILYIPRDYKQGKISLPAPNNKKQLHAYIDHERKHFAIWSYYSFNPLIVFKKTKKP